MQHTIRNAIVSSSYHIKQLMQEHQRLEEILKDMEKPLTYYRPKYFCGYELVDKKTYSEIGDMVFNFFPAGLLYTIDRIRHKFGRAVCNTWYWGGSSQWRGYRSPDCKIGADYSLHRFYRAVDLIFTETTAETVRQDILSQPDSDAYRYITRIELDTGWLHIDFANVERIQTFKP